MIMGIFLDSGFFIGLSHPDDSNHAKSVKILREISTGEYGLIYTSSFVIAGSTLVLLIGFNQLNLLYKIADKEVLMTDDLKVMSYNVRLFNIYKWKKERKK